MGQCLITRKGGGGLKLYDLGTAQSFNIKTLCPNVDYTKLTVDNFIFIELPTISYKSGNKGSMCDNNSGLGGTGSVSKSYNASTGVLSCSYTMNAIWYRGCNVSCSQGNNHSATVSVHVGLLV